VPSAGLQMVGFMWGLILEQSLVHGGRLPVRASCGTSIIMSACVWSQREVEFRAPTRPMPAALWILARYCGIPS
jgi:hypothetical protein